MNHSGVIAAPSPTEEFSIQSIRELVEEDFQAVDRLILNHLHSEVPLIQQISQHIIKSGGKRLRPLLVLLGAKTFNYEGEDHIALAAAVEFIHTATLLHDDVVDNSSLRRGKNTANAIWGNAASVLVGDFLYSRTFQILTHIQNRKVMDLLADTTNTIAEGEVLQLVKRNNPSTSENDYMQIIRHKTAKLFEASAQMGSLLSNRSQREQKAIAAYGLHLGTAFQLIDDVLDYSGTPQELGKNIGDDLAEGKPTLPLIHAMQQGTKEDETIIQHAIQNGGLENIELILNAIYRNKSLDYTMQKAQFEAELATAHLTQIPQSSFRQALFSLAEFIVKRRY